MAKGWLQKLDQSLKPIDFRVDRLRPQIGRCLAYREVAAWGMIATGEERL